MTKIAATFSNGYVDEYKGKRPVKAAWAIYVDDELALSGHSMDRAKAEKTASGNVRYLSEYDGTFQRPNSWAGPHAYYTKLARKNGFGSWKQAYEAQQARNAKWVAEHVKIEIVDL